MNTERPIQRTHCNSFVKIILQGSALATILLFLGGVSPLQAGGLVAIDFDLSNFSTPLDIDNPYWPMPEGATFVYHETSVDECVVVDFQVTSTIKSGFLGDYAGLTARQIMEREWLDEDCDGGRDILLEDTFDWFAQDDAGNIWYVGEATTSFPSGSTAGSWEAGTDGADAGIIMLANPQPGLFYSQERRPGEAEDMGKVQRLNAKLSLSVRGDFGNCLSVKEWNPLSPGSVEHKYYCPGIGLLFVSELSGGKTVPVEAVEYFLP